MKANELMIGDWVRIKDNVEDDAYLMHDDMHPGQSVKTEEILSYGINPDWCGGEINDYLPEDAIEPIPLTAEILEKSGFEKQNEVLHILKCSNEHYPNLIFVEYVMSNKCLFINDVMLPRPILYVHELQHALKLVDIDKEIKL